MVAVGTGAAMARQMLEHRQDAAGLQSLRYRSRYGRDLAGLGSIGPVADHRVAAGGRNVCQRKTVNVYPENVQICCNQAASKPRSGQSNGLLPVIQRSIAGP